MSEKSALTSAEVAHLADLSRIAMTEDELTRMAGDLNSILTHVARVSEVATPEVPATSHPIALSNVLREDVVGETLTNEQALSGAPESQDAKFLVPQILGED